MLILFYLLRFALISVSFGGKINKLFRIEYVSNLTHKFLLTILKRKLPRFINTFACERFFLKEKLMKYFVFKMSQI